MKNFSFMFDAGFGYPYYLAHLTLGVGKYTLWLNIIAGNWKTMHLGRDMFGCPRGCLSVFTFTFTRQRG